MTTDPREYLTDVLAKAESDSAMQRESELVDYLSAESMESEDPAVQRLAKFDPHTLRTIFRAGFDSDHANNPAMARALLKVLDEIDLMVSSHQLNLENDGYPELLEPELVSVNKACIAVLGRTRRTITTELTKEPS